MYIGVDRFYAPGQYSILNMDYVSRIWIKGAGRHFKVNLKCVEGKGVPTFSRDRRSVQALY